MLGGSAIPRQLMVEVWQANTLRCSRIYYFSDTTKTFLHMQMAKSLSLFRDGILSSTTPRHFEVTCPHSCKISLPPLALGAGMLTLGCRVVLGVVWSQGRVPRFLPSALLVALLDEETKKQLGML